MKDGPIELSDADVRIIQCLQKDARSSVAGLAQTLRMPTSSVRVRLQRLVENGVLKFDAMANPLRLGYQVWVMLEIQVDITRTESVANRLASEPQIYLVYIMTGGYDILVGAVFRSNEEFLEFITRRLARIPGITRTSSSSVLKMVKRTMSFPLPATARPARERKARPRRPRLSQRTSPQESTRR